MITDFRVYCTLQSFVCFRAQNVFPGLHRSQAMFKYTDKQQLLYIYSVTVQSIVERSTQVAEKLFS